MTRHQLSATKTCNRCFFGMEKPATASVEFSIDGVYYDLELCEAHATQFDREISGWRMVAEEIDPPATGRPKSQYFTEERKREAARITELRDKVTRKAAAEEFAERRAREIAAEIEQAAELRARQSIPGAMPWRFTDHARERMVQREFTVEEVLRAVAQPQHIFWQPWRGPHIEVHQHGDCRVVVNDNSKAIITVIDRGDKLETSPPAPSAEQKAKTS